MLTMCWSSDLVCGWCFTEASSFFHTNQQWRLIIWRWLSPLLTTRHHFPRTLWADHSIWVTELTVTLWFTPGFGPSATRDTRVGRVWMRPSPLAHWWERRNKQECTRDAKTWLFCSNKESEIDSTKDLTLFFRSEASSSRHVRVIMLRKIKFRRHTCQVLTAASHRLSRNAHIFSPWCSAASILSKRLSCSLGRLCLASPP